MIGGGANPNSHLPIRKRLGHERGNIRSQGHKHRRRSAACDVPLISLSWRHRCSWCSPDNSPWPGPHSRWPVPVNFIAASLVPSPSVKVRSVTCAKVNCPLTTDIATFTAPLAASVCATPMSVIDSGVSPTSGSVPADFMAPSLALSPSVNVGLRLWPPNRYCPDRRHRY